MLKIDPIGHERIKVPELRQKTQRKNATSQTKTADSDDGGRCLQRRTDLHIDILDGFRTFKSSLFSKQFIRRVARPKE